MSTSNSPERSLPPWQIAYVVLEELTDLLALMRAYYEFYGVSPADSDLLKMARAPHRRPRPYTLLPTGSRAFAVHHCGARIQNTHRPLAMQLVDWQRVGDALRSDLGPRAPG